MAGATHHTRGTTTTPISNGAVPHNADMGESSFTSKYRDAVRENGSLLCVGLDPNPKRMPKGMDLADFLCGVVHATKHLVCAYKPNSPFFEATGAAGFEALEQVIAEIRPTGIPVILDSKRADIPDTSEFFAVSAFEHFKADAIVANPYLGSDALEPFFSREQKHTFVLCRTSNQVGASEFQNLLVGPDQHSLYIEVARRAKEWNTRGNVGLVAAATDTAATKQIRETCPDQLLLMPGLGWQGARLEEAVQSGLDAKGGGVVLNVSRDVLYAGRDLDDYADSFARAAEQAAQRFRTRINEAVSNVMTVGATS